MIRAGSLPTLSVRTKPLLSRRALSLDPSQVGRAVIASILLYGLAIWWLLFFSPSDTELSTDAAATGTKDLNQVIWIGLFAISSLNWFMARSWTSAKRLMPTLWPVLAYLGLALISITWALSPDAAIRRAILQAMFIASLSFSVLVVRDRRQILSDFMIVLVLVALANLVALVTRPPTPLGHAGIYGQKNVLGSVAAIMVLVGIGNVFKRNLIKRCLALFLLGSAGIFLILSQSKTSLGLVILIPGIVGGCLILSSVLRIGLGTVLSFILSVLGCAGLLVVQTFNISRETLLTVLVGDPTFTGRTFIWDFVIPYIDQNPWLGHGFNSFWAIGDASPAVREGPGFIPLIIQSHNGYLDILLDLGWAGLLFVFLSLVLTIMRFTASPGWSTSDRLVMLCLIMFVFMHNLMESSIFRSTHFIWAIYLLVSLIIASGATMRSHETKNERF